MFHCIAVILWTVCSLPFHCFAANEDGVDKLFTDKIWQNNPYKRPVTNESDVVYVSLSFEIRVVLGYDESSQLIKCIGWFSVVWNDPFLSWDPELYGLVTMVMPPSSLVWKPPLFVTDMVEGPTVLEEHSFSMRLNYSGQITWGSPAVFHIYCHSDMLKYPYERLRCTFHIVVWTYRTKEVVLLPAQMSLANTLQRAQWEISDAVVASRVINVLDDEHSVVELSFRVLRISDSFTFTFVMPVINLAVLGTFVFLIPASTGEKLSFAITVCLSYGVYMGFLITMIPLNSGLSSFTIFLVVSIVLSSVYTVLSIASVNLSTRVDDVYPVSRRLATLVLLAERVLVLKGQNRLGSHVSPAASDSVGFGSTRAVLEEDKGEHSRVTWDRVSRALDKLCFVLFFPGVLIVSGCILSVTFTSK